MVRRLRRRLPEAKIFAGFWQSGPGQASELCAATKADFCATSFKDAVAFCLDATVQVRQRAEISDVAIPRKSRQAAIERLARG